MTSIEKRKQHRFMLLQNLYTSLDGDFSAHVDRNELFTEMKAFGMTYNDAENAWSWLVDEGLCENISYSAVGITHAGVLEIESAHDRPNEPTNHFEPAVINPVFHFHGSVGAVQTGSHNIANVMQQVNEGVDLLSLIGQLRAGTDRLDGEAKSEAIELVDTLEEQAKSAQPRKALVKRCADGLKDHMTWLVPTIQLIYEIFLKKS